LHFVQAVAIRANQGATVVQGERVTSPVYTSLGLGGTHGMPDPRLRGDDTAAF
jgi:hypothetical protein